MNKFLKPAWLMIMMSLTASCTNELKQTYSVELKSPQDVTFDNAVIKVKLFGTHRMAADNKATLVYETTQPIKALPSTIKLDWDKEAYKKIKDPAVNKAEDAAYYLNITVDANNDGQFCRGDYRQNYELSPFEQITAIPTRPLTYNLTVTDQNGCENF